MSNVNNEILGFFSAISAWREAYTLARLHYVAVKRNEKLSLIAARIYLNNGSDMKVSPQYKAGHIEAGYLDIPQTEISVEGVIEKLISENGYVVDRIGTLILERDPNHSGFFASTNLFHPEGLNTGNRIGVLSITGTQKANLVTQPETDWCLKASESPFDSLGELCVEYSLGVPFGDATRLEVVAGTIVEVLAASNVDGDLATIGLWMLPRLKKVKGRIGFRILDKHIVVERGAISGDKLTWREEKHAVVGTATLKVPRGAVVHCIASYEGQAHHVGWRFDPKFFQNARSALLALVDPGQKLIRAYLSPDQPPKGSASDDFEEAVAWLVWMFGFSTASFGRNPKTRDFFDMVATSPRGDFVVVECTLGLLRADRKLSKLAARVVQLREQLDASEMRHLRILPVIVTAMTAEQVNADIGHAESLGIAVVTRDRFDEALTESLRLSDADAMFDRVFEATMRKKIAR